MKRLGKIRSAFVAGLALCAGAAACGLDEADQQAGGSSGGKEDFIVQLPLTAWSQGCWKLDFVSRHQAPCANQELYRCRAKDDRSGDFECATGAAGKMYKGIDAKLWGSSDGFRSLADEKAFLDSFSGNNKAWRASESWAASCTINAKLEAFKLIDLSKNLPGDKGDYATMIGKVIEALDAAQPGCSKWLVVMGSGEQNEGLVCGDYFDRESDECKAANPAPVDQTPVDQAPVDQAPVDQTPVDQTPANASGPTSATLGPAFSAVIGGEVVVVGSVPACDEAMVTLTKVSGVARSIYATGHYVWVDDDGTWLWNSDSHPDVFGPPCEGPVGFGTEWYCHLDDFINLFPRKTLFIYTVDGVTYVDTFKLGCYK